MWGDCLDGMLCAVWCLVLLRCRGMYRVCTRWRWFLHCMFLDQFCFCGCYNADITISWLVLLLGDVSLIICLESSLSRSSQRKMWSIFCFNTFYSVNFGTISKKSPMLASFWNLYLFILRYDRFSRSVSRIPFDELCFEPYLISINCIQIQE